MFFRKLLVTASFIAGCSIFNGFSYGQIPDDYIAEMEAWYLKRLHDLKAPDGWVNLAGLYWLKEGKNSFGRDSTNTLIYNGTEMPEVAGYFEWNNHSVYWNTSKPARVHIGYQSVERVIVYHPDSVKAPVLAMGPYRWNIIKRDDKLGVRFRDLNHPELEKLTRLDYFPIDTAWRIKAMFEPSPGNSINIVNMIGQTTAQRSPGRVIFTIDNHTYSFDVLESTNDELFIIFGDETSGTETYAAGRYLYVKKPHPGLPTIIDFNKAINPPCVFTDFATCPLPPPQNILPIKVTAGEKKYGNR